MPRRLCQRVIAVCAYYRRQKALVQFGKIPKNLVQNRLFGANCNNCTLQNYNCFYNCKNRAEKIDKNKVQILCSFAD